MELLSDPPQWELYDLEADLWQFHNLAAEPAHAETLKRMQGLLLDWQAAHPSSRVPESPARTAPASEQVE
jgi:hypothetical protein